MMKISRLPSLKKQLAADKRLEELASKNLQMLGAHMEQEENNIVRNHDGAYSLAPHLPIIN